MGLLETEIVELRKLAEDVMEERVSMTKASMQLSIYSQVAKRERLMFDIWKTASKQKGVLKNAKSKNLIDGVGAIECICEGCSKVICVAKGDTLITHEECLEYSGVEHHLDECQLCENFKTTRRRLLKNN